MWLLLWATAALAAGWGSVEALWALDADGVLQPTQQTAEGSRTRGEDTRSLSVGLDLEPGDVVRTLDARARLRLGSDEQIVLEPGAAVTVSADRTILQELGEALYRVQGIFNVRYGSVEAAVEGTLFRVEITADGQMVVEVLEGTVVVRSEGTDTRLRRGEQASLVLGAVSPPASLAPKRPLVPDGSDPRRGLGDGRLTLGLYAGVASYEDGGGLVPSLGTNGTGVSWRGAVGYRIAPSWRATLDAGTVTSGGRFFVPSSVGAEWRRGLLRLGGAATVLLGDCGCDGEQQLDVRIGAAGVAGLTLPVAYGFSLEGRSRLGATASTQTDEPPELLYDLSAGVSWGW